MRWGWTPEAGRWRLADHGYPRVPAPISVSTAGVAAAQSYDYWRNLAFADFEPDPVTREDRLTFSAKAEGLASEKADFFLTQSAAVSGGRERHHIDQDGLETVSVGVVLKGTRQSEQVGDASLTARAGSFFAYDAAHAGRVSWSAHKAVYLVLRRNDVVAALGEVPRPSQLIQRLHQSTMRHVVSDQFQMLARHMRVLDPEQRGYLLDQTVQLTLFALAKSAEDDAPAQSEAGYLAAAMRFIDLHLADPRLDADHIAAALNCSRATLYRVFAQEGLGVAEAIRSARLERARVLVETVPTRSISDIAVECGLFDTVNFSRHFRRRFGLSPTDARALAAGRR